MADTAGLQLHLGHAPPEFALQSVGDGGGAEVGSQLEPTAATLLAKEQLAALLHHLLAGADRQLQLEQHVRQLESEAEAHTASAFVTELEALELESSALKRELKAGEVMEANWTAQLAAMHAQQKQLQQIIISAKRDAHAASPAITDLMKAIKALEQDVTAEQDNLASMEEQVNFMRSDLAGKDERISCMQVDVQQLREVAEKPLPPPSAAKQVELQQLHRETDWVVVNIKKSDSKKDKVNAAELAADLRLEGQQRTVEAHAAAQEAHAQHAAQLTKDMELARLQGENHLAEKVNLEAETRKELAEIRRQQAVVWRAGMESDRAKQALHGAGIALELAQDALTRAQAERAQDAVLVKQMLAERTAAVLQARQEVDTLLQDILQREDKETAQRRLLAALMEDVTAREDEIEALRQAEVAQSEALHMATCKRDAARRYMAVQEHQLQDVRSAVAAGLPAIQEAVGAIKDHDEHEAELRILCDLLRQQRNKSSHLRKAAVARVEKELAVQAAQEGQLRNMRTLELEHINAAQVQRTARSTSINERMRLQRAYNKVVDETDAIAKEELTAHAEAASLMAAMTIVEANSSALQHRYKSLKAASQGTIRACGARSAQIDVLQLRTSVQGDICTGGGLELQRIELGIRTLKLHTAEVLRAAQLAQRHLPHVASLDAQIALLKMRLMIEQQHAGQLSRQLEVPTVGVRWQALGGEKEHAGKLAAQAAALQERLGEQHTRLSTSKLALDESTALAEHLASAAAEQHPHHLAIGRQANEVQVRLRDVTRTLMATASELSLYKVSALECEQALLSLRSQLSTVMDRVARGQAPSEEALQEWMASQRGQLCNDDKLQGREQWLSMPEQTACSTAEPRPHSYVPEGTQQFKPYGAFPAFKPGDGR